ncbi:PDDEXK nuclease domain-containing protein [Pyxidicoccus sp. 3LG]
MEAQYGRGFGEKNLRRMVQFSAVFPDVETVAALLRELGWTHFTMLIPIKDSLKREFYAEMCRAERWSTGDLRQQLDGMLFERTALSKKPEALIRKELSALREKGELSPALVFRDPYMLDFLELADTYSEKGLESAILREIERFLLELGAGFAFVERQKRITLDGDDYYLDLLFFHRRMQRLVAIELKIGGPHGEIAPAVWRALQTYRRAIAPQSLAWYGSDDGDTLPLDDKGWEHIREQLLERPWGDAWAVDLDEKCGEVGGYNFEYRGWRLDAPAFSHDEDSSCGVAFSLPTDYLLERGPAQLRALSLGLGRELPFSFGYASLAFVSPRGRWFAARREMLGTLARYLGLDLYRLGISSRLIGTRARGAYWLTFLGQPLVGQLGGNDVLRQRLAFPEVTVEPMDGERLLLTLGEWPDAIDTQMGAVPPQYRVLARLLEPYLCEEGGDWPPMKREYMHRWLRRLCP